MGLGEAGSDRRPQFQVMKHRVMKHGTLTCTFEHYWHCGSGQAGDGDVDAVPVTEDCGLPFVPGRAIRGRLKWAAREAGWDNCRIQALFGTPDASNLDSMGRLRVASGFMQGPFAKQAIRSYKRDGRIDPQVTALFEDIASTALKDGVADDRTLRRVRYAVPVKVKAEVSLEEHESACTWDDLRALADRIRAIGKGKHDGFGWCAVALSEPHDAVLKPDKPADAATYDLEIELLDDVVLSATSATVGGHRTLDYVPGSALMGSCARHLFFSCGEEKAATALLTGAVSFGNGTPAESDNATLPVPFSWHHAKGEPGIEDGTVKKEKVTDLAALSYADSALGRNGKQPVQMREGWLDTVTGRIAAVKRTETLKTAIDEKLENYETAAEGQLYGYEAIKKGAWFTSRIEVTGSETEFCEALRVAFDGTTIRLGRSKGTEFGRARCALRSAGDHAAPTTATVNGPVTLLVESDLALLDANGFPKLTPAPEHFGLKPEEGWVLCRDHSYLRHRRYSLWNAKRGGSDVERQVISKGSVIVFRNSSPEKSATVNLRVGLGRAEGLGRVRLAESWLKGEHPAFPPLVPPKEGEVREGENSGTNTGTDAFSKWVAARHEEQQFDLQANRLGKKWADEWRKAARKNKASLSPSQWGRLDQAARAFENKGPLVAALGQPEPNQNTIFGHGRKQKEWGKGVACAVLRSLADEANDRLALAAFRAACHDIAAKQRRDRH